MEIRDPSYRHRATLADTIDKLSPDSLQRVGRTLEVWLEEGQARSDQETQRLGD